MPKRANQTNNTKSNCKRSKTCLAIHADTVELLEFIHEQLADAIAMLEDQYVALTAESDEEEEEVDPAPSQEA